MANVPIVCITGCSSGFGLNIALECAKTCQVIATVRSEKGKNLLLDQMIKKNVSIDIQLCDVTDTQSIQQLSDYIKKEYKTLNVLINNAGIGLGGFFEDTPAEQIDAVFQTNCFGLMAMTKACLPLLKQASSAKVINISSIAGLTGTPMISIYNSSKWAVEGLSEALLFELKPFGVDVILIEPGQFKTKIFNENLNLADGVSNKHSDYYALSQTALKRFQVKQAKGVPDPKPVVSLCARLVHQKRTRFRYLVGKDAYARFLVRRWLPFELYRWLVNKVIATLVR
tara:strand:- start:439 stop:1290 length:852 start_codon:yes stop_codon:yes gene_type:complete